jgi:F-type H+-transporting ATPase subunit b
MLEINITAGVILVSFFLFMFLMKGVFFDPIAAIKLQREQKLQEDLEQARALSKEHEALYQTYEAQLKEARQKAQKVIMEFRERAKGEAFAKTQAAREEAQVQLEEQLAAIAKQREQVYQELESERTSLVQSILTKIVRSGSLSGKHAASSVEHG